MSNHHQPWLQGSSLFAWLYTLVLSLLSGVVGGGLIALCYNSFSLPVTETGIVKRMCLVTGVVLTVFVLFWNLFIFCTWKGSSYAIEKCPRGKEPTNSSRSRVRVTPLLGLLSLFLLIISILLELSGTGLFWWASQQLADLYLVRGKCFCARGSGQPGSGKRDVFDVNCPMVEGMVCEVVYSEMMVNMGSVTVSTRDCQRLDGSQQDPACLEYRQFWNFFKVLRVVLPVLAIVKLPVLVMNCSRWFCKEEKNLKSSHGKFATDSVSWIGLDVLLSPLRLVDPVQFYSNMCTPVSNQPPLGERLGPVGQEKDQEMNSLPFKQATLRGSIPIGTDLTPTRINPFLTAVQCPVAPYDMGLEELQTSRSRITKDDSPPDIEEHTISTPKHPRLKTPSFDLSKVVKPVYHNNSMEAEVPTRKLNLKPDVIRSSRVSSFSSSQNFKVPPPPPLPKPDSTEPCLIAQHQRPPFIRSATTLPRPVRLNSEDSNPILPNQAPLDPVISCQMSPTPTSTVQLVLDPPSDIDTSGSVQSVTPIIRLKPINSRSNKSSPKCQGSTPLQLSLSIKEISQKARNLSSSSNVDWSKLP